MAHPVGEREAGVLRLDFDRRLKLEFHGSKVIADAGLLPYRELDDAVGLAEIAAEVLTDTRCGKNSRHGLVGQIRQFVFEHLGGYVAFQLAAVAVPKELFWKILSLIEDLRRRPAPA